MNCPACGSDNREAARFCGECAAPLVRDTACPRCGVENPAGRKFCDACGTSLAPTRGRDPSLDPRAYTPKHLAEKILASKGALEGERKQVTVLFADVRSSMELAEQLDPEEWHRILDRFFGILTNGVHRFEGTVNQYTGDGIMALFGAPVAHEDHAQRACYSALHLQGELRRYADELRVDRGLSFAARIGLNSGEVIVGKIGDDLRMDYTAQGHTVGLASRVERLAEPGTVFLTERTARLVEGFFQLRDLGTSSVAGSAEPLRLYVLEGVGPARTRLQVSRARGLTRFVGRAEEIATLDAALRRAEAGDGQVVGVVGEAGVGKSRLCLELAEAWRARGISVFEAHCPAHGKTVPFLPILELLRDALGIGPRDGDQLAREKIAGRLLLLDRSFDAALPLVFDFLGVPDPERPTPPLDPELRQRRLFEFLRSLVRARGKRESAVLLFDDVHWIDPGSDGFLAQLVEAVAGTRTILLLNFRPEYRAEWMQRSYYHQLPLSPFGPEELADLLAELLGRHRSIAGLARTIGDRTEGNPFFAEEAVQSLVESRALLGERGAYRLVGAVDDLRIPATVQAILAARIDRLHEREKQVLGVAAVIGREVPGTLLERVAELPAEQLGAALGQLRQAEFMQETALYPEIVHRFKHPLTQLVAYESQLGERRARTHAAVARALEELRGDRLEEYAALVADHWERAGERAHALRCYRLAGEWSRDRDPAASRRHWHRVRILAQSLPSSRETAGAQILASWRLLVLANFTGIPADEADALLAEGTALAGAADDLRSAALVELAYANVKGLRGEFVDMLAHAKAAMRIAEGMDDVWLRLGAAQLVMRPLLWTCRYQELWDVCHDGLDLLRREPTPRSGSMRATTHLAFLSYRGTLLRLFKHQLSESLATHEEVIGLARQHQAHPIRVNACHDATWTAQAIGDAAKALSLAQQAVEVAENYGGVEALSQAYLALALARNLGRDWDGALEAVERVQSIAASSQVGIENAFLARLQASESHLGRGELVPARREASEALAFIRARELKIIEIVPIMLLAQIALAESSIEEAEALLGRWQQLVDEGGADPLAPAHLHVARARLAGSGGDDAAEERVNHLREAHRLFTEMGATGHAERVARELAELRPKP